MVVDWKAKKSGDQKVPKNEKSHMKAPRHKSFSLRALNLCERKSALECRSALRLWFCFLTISKDLQDYIV